MSIQIPGSKVRKEYVAIKETYCSFRGHEFNSKYLHLNSSARSSSSICGHPPTHGIDIYIDNDE